MIVICLEGCHGSGKTELVKLFHLAGFPVLDEAFLDMHAFALHPQTLTMETIWVAHWIQRLLQRQQDTECSAPGLRDQIYIADRSPYSAVFYAKNRGELLHPLIEQMIKELGAAADIHVYTVYIRVEPDLLWKRIDERLKREPGRLKYNEDSREWMETTVRFYEGTERNWDFVVENNENTLTELLQFVLSTLRSKVERFKESCPMGLEDTDRKNPQVSPIKVHT